MTAARITPNARRNVYKALGRQLRASPEAVAEVHEQIEQGRPSRGVMQIRIRHAVQGAIRSKLL